VGKSYLSVAINIIKHPTNPSGYVAAALLYCNPSAPLVATVMGEIGKESAVGAFMSGAYAGINSAYISTASLGLVQYNPQTGLGGLNTLGVGNCLGLLSLGYLNMSANGEMQVHAGHSRLTHLENEGKGLGDFVENMVSGMAGVAIGLCYDMPMDFAHGEYYEAGYACGYNTAVLLTMIAAPEDAGAGVGAKADAAGADEGEAADAGGDAARAASKKKEPEGFREAFKASINKAFKDRRKAGEDFTAKLGRGVKGKFGLKSYRAMKQGKFAEYAGEYMGKQIVNQSLYLNNFNNLNMTDPRSPWSTAAWQNMIYRQGPYTADKN
jgi:hypothetical protein